MPEEESSENLPWVQSQTALFFTLVLTLEFHRASYRPAELAVRERRFSYFSSGIFVTDTPSDLEEFAYCGVISAHIVKT